MLDEICGDPLQIIGIVWNGREGRVCCGGGLQGHEYEVCFPRLPIGAVLYSKLNLSAKWTELEEGRTVGRMTTEIEAWLARDAVWSRLEWPVVAEFVE